VERKQIIAVAMSGGVDSSVTAGILAQQGYKIIGVHLDLWSGFLEEKGEKKRRARAAEIIERIAQKFNFPFEIIDAKDKFKESIVKYFIDEIKHGITPNPCVLCNKNIKFGFLFNNVKKFGITKIATGHYARRLLLKNGEVILRKGIDEKKDQSYYLCLLSQEQLHIAMFPIGNKYKKEIIEQAVKWGLETKKNKESQDLCFLAGHDYREFIKRYAPGSQKIGDIVDKEGRIIGSHIGIGFYTIGQRKGLGISSNKALFVIRKDILKNQLIVGEEGDLGKNKFEVTRVNWITKGEHLNPFYANIKIRYQAKLVKAKIIPVGENEVLVHLSKPLRDITPGQFAVFYHKDNVLGGGSIKI